ncbi:MAG: metal ABC transporter permease [Desulfurococcaceae archaeon]
MYYRLIAYVAMGGAMAAISFVVYYRRLEFLAAGATHSALLAVVLGVLLEYYTGLNHYVLALLIGLAVIYAAGVLVKMGLTPEKASALLVSFTSASAVLSVHYALTMMPGRVSLSALILGDPLLLTVDEAVLGITLSFTIIAAVYLLRRAVVETSVDEVSAKIAGLNTAFYDLVVYTLIGAVTIGMLRLAGYVMEHVFVLLPALATAEFSGSTDEHLVLTITAGVLSALLGYLLSYLVRSIPTGVTGLLLLALFILSRLKPRR